MTKILNLDEFESPTEKVLRFKGKDHTYKPMSVQEFIDTMKEAEETKERPLSETVDYMVKMIVRAFPTAPEVELRKLPLDRLKLISDFVNDVNQDEVEAAQEEPGKNG